MRKPVRRAASASVQVPGASAKSSEITPWFVGQRPVQSVAAVAALDGEGARNSRTLPARSSSASSAGCATGPSGHVDAVITINDDFAARGESGTAGASPNNLTPSTIGPSKTKAARAKRATRSFTTRSSR